MSAIITSGNMDQMIAAYGSEYLINHGLVLPVTCDECGGSGEYVFNTDPRRDPVNDQVKPCKCWRAAHGAPSGVPKSPG